MTFHERLRAARELRQWSRRSLASRAGLSTSLIVHLENGSRKPSFHTLLRLVNTLEVAADYLLGRVNEPDIPKACDPLWRDVGHLSGYDRELAKDFLKLLAQRPQLVHHNTRMKFHELRPLEDE